MKKKKAIIEEYKEYFVTGSSEKNIKGCVANGIPEDVARKVYSDMERFAGYAFNKSHAVAYSMHTVRTAWLSLHYFPEYMTAVLNANIKKPDKLRGYFPVIKARKVKLLPPDINKSGAEFTTNGKEIRFGLAGLKGVGATSRALLAEREENGEFKSYAEFLSRMAKCSKINKTSLSALIYAGCLDAFDGSSRKAKIDGIDAATAFIKKERAGKRTKKNPVLFEDDPEHVTVDYDKTVPEMPKKELLAHEEEISGFYMSGHPLDEYGDVLKADGTVRTISSIINEFEPIAGEDEEDNEEDHATLYDVKVAGIVKKVERRLTKKGKPWWNLTLEDKTGVMKCTYFFRDNKDRTEDLTPIMAKGALVEFQGRVSDSGYGPEMTVDYAISLSQYMNVTQAPLLLLTIFDDAKYVDIEYGQKITRSACDYVKRVLYFDDDHKDSYKNKRKGAYICYRLMGSDGIELGRYRLGNRFLSLEQFVKLEYCLGSDNVKPVFNAKK